MRDILVTLSFLCATSGLTLSIYDFYDRRKKDGKNKK